MDKIISCEFDIDTACVEVKFADGSMISFDCTLVEAYVNLLLHGDIRGYLKNVTEYYPFEN